MASRSSCAVAGWKARAPLGLLALVIGTVLCASTAELPAQAAQVIEIEHFVEAAKGAGGEWAKAQVGQSLAAGDRIRTRQRSRALVRLTDLYTLRMEQLTTIAITADLVAGDRPRLDLGAGAAFLFSREKSSEIGIKTPTANAAMRGTQLFVRVGADGRSFFQVVEGEVDLTNPHGMLPLGPGEAGEVLPGRAPRRTAVIAADNLLQWALYYPAVLDPRELGLDAATHPALARSLAAYRSGDLPGALAALPDRAPAARGARIYQSGVLLAVGRVDEAHRLLASVPAADPGRRALERMIAAVQFREQAAWQVKSLPTAAEALAESYYRQSRAAVDRDALAAAREAARRATELAPANGFAWTRLAELEFSFGRSRQARAALERGLALTPRNAQAHALRGFLLSGDGRIAEAQAAFEEAIRLDGALGNGWLGLGLTKIKRGDLADGRADLQVAATVEPNLSQFQSYLAKALATEGRDDEADKSLALARQLDPHDPTPLLYSAIEKQRRNRPNEAIADLEQSIALNDNRRVYRSGLLLDQDRAVRSANLAKIYQHAGMDAVAVREAARAVECDYTNPSAHLFLANAYDALRDPWRVQLRYETPWFNELLLANLLGPVGGGPLSQYVSQQEYSKLLEADGIGASLDTEWRDGSQLRSTASVFGTYGKMSFGIDASWFDSDGDRPNSDIDLREVYAQFKFQVTPDDTFYLLGKWQDEESGDNFLTYDNRPLSADLRFEETQQPGLLLGGWNHRWAPGSHTLFLGGRLAADQRLTDPTTGQLLIERDAAGLRPDFLERIGFFDRFTDPALRTAVPPSVQLAPDGETLIYSPELLAAIAPHLGDGDVLGVTTGPFDFDTRRRFEIYTAELQHILQTDRNTLLAGGRVQCGEFETDATLHAARPNFYGGFPTPAADQHSVTDFQRTSLYLYDYWSPLPWLTLVGGVAWDRIEHPDNFRNPPVNDDQRTDEELSSKLGFTMAPADWLVVRGAYTEGLGGVTFDESVRLEPTQVAGFNQAWRTLVSESLAGSVEAPRYQNWGLAAEGVLPTRTWWGLTATVVEQDVDRTLGAFTGYTSNVFPNTPAYFPDGTRQRLDYREESLTATVNQLLGSQFAVGAGYRVARSELRTTYPELLAAAAAGVPGASVADQATLHEIGLHADWNSPRGWFARVEANWFSQSLDDDPRGRPPGAPARPGDSFWQFNAFAGYRFNANLCEVSAGVLNIGGGDYQLSPLNPYPDLPRRTTAVLRCRLGF